MSFWSTLLLVALTAPAGALAQGAGSITLSSDPPTLTVTFAGAGSGFIPGTNSSTTYTVIVLGLGMGILGQLDAPMPNHTSLRATLAAPGGATSLGPVPLSVTPQALVRDLPLGSFSGLPITYEFIAVAAAGVVPLTSRNVTFTVTAIP